MRKMRLAIIGASNIARKLLPIICTIDEIDLVGVYSRDLFRSQRLVSEAGIAKAYGSYEECFSASDVDAVYVTTHNCSHANLIEHALSCGKHVLCEKPMFLKRSDALALSALAKSRGLILVEGFMYRLRPQVKKAVDLIRTHTIGDIKEINVRLCFSLYELNEKRPLRSTAAAGGGALNDVGCYGVDFINWIMNECNLSSEDYTVRAESLQDREIDLMTTAVISFTAGVTARLICSVDRASFNLWEVVGTKGSVSMPRFDTVSEAKTQVYCINEESELLTHSCEAGDQYRQEFEMFARAVLQNSTPFISLEESVKNATLLEHIREAANAFSRPR